MTMHNPTHPGAILREDVPKPLGINITETAVALGVSRKTLSKILNEHGSITAEMAMRLELATRRRNNGCACRHPTTSIRPEPARRNWPAKFTRLQRET